MPALVKDIQTLIDDNDELENYFSNTIIPQCLINADLILQKITLPLMKQFHLNISDIGKPLTDISVKFSFPSIIENIRHVIHTNEGFEKEIQTTDLRWYQMNITPYVIRKTNTTNGVIITFMEITLRIKDLKAYEKLIADHEILIDTISHDMKNPLTSLILAVDSFKVVCPENSPQFQMLLKIVDNSVEKMKNIIYELTDSRKQQHKYTDEKELINFENIIEDVRHAIADNIAEAGALLKSEINVPEITFSRRKLRSLLFNLVNNAIKFRSPDRIAEVHIKTTKVHNGIMISVRDNGIGIEPEKQSHIFSKYFRIENGIEGSGVGLYLVKEIVRNSGGKISVSSQPGIGTEFQILLKED